MRFSWTSRWLTVMAIALCAMAGCASIPNSGIDPTGERIFAAPPPPTGTDRSNERYFDHPLGQLPWDDVSVSLQTCEKVAPVGSEVVLIAGVCGSDGYLRTNRRLEWSIDPGSVGQFVAVGRNGLVDLLLGDFNQPRKITNTYAIGSTSRSNIRLNRGACSPEGFEYVLRGQGWITITSPTEGTSHVTVVSPKVYRWDKRTKSAVIHWVDAQWQFPTPAINPAGTTHVFTTTVTRRSNQSPCEGWRVRYEIVDGPPAGFLPDGVSVIEAPVDSTGQARVELFQKQPRHGTNNVAIQVIRPADLPGAGGQRLVVGSGATMKTWTGADLAVNVTGPATASPGAALTYRIDVSNPGDLSAKDVVATSTMPEGLTYLTSNPPAEMLGRQLQWRLGELGARQQHTIKVDYRAERQGSVTNCCEAAAAGGLKVSHCATTTVGSPSLEVRVTGPSQANVGSEVTFEITVTNRSQTPATKLRIRDKLDSGLEHPLADEQNAIDNRDLGDLAPGASQRINVTFRVTKPGRLCHTVEVTGDGIAPAIAEGCVTGIGNGVAPGEGPPSDIPPFGGDTTPRPDWTVPTFKVEKTGPRQLSVGETARFVIVVTNTGSTALQNVQVLDRYDAALTPVMATDGYRIEGGGLAWTIENLPAGKASKLEVHCTCQTIAANACNRVTVTAPDGAKVDDEACLEIRAAGTTPSETTPFFPPIDEGLTMTVTGLRNPVAVGKELTYEIRVTNTGMQSYQQLSVAVEVPEGMVANPMGTTGPDATKFTIDRGAVSFDPVSELRPRESLIYRVRVRTKQPGQFRLRAELNSPALTQPLAKEESTEVF